MSREIPAVEATDLVKRYKLRNRGLKKEFWRFFSIVFGSGGPTLTALDHINLEIAKGEVFGLLGPNGAGKTTLIKILCTLVLPDSGRAKVNGIDVVKQPRKAVKILQAVLAGGTGFERRLTARQNLELYATLYGIPKNVARKKIDDLLEFTHLTDRADSMFQRLSTGNERRLLLAKALLKDASIILFDEPTTGLDPIAQAEFRDLMKDVLSKQEGKTIIVSTHNLWEAEQICDRIAVLQKGKITAIGTPSEIRHAATDWTSLSIGLAPPVAVKIPRVAEEFRHIDGVSQVELSENKDGSLILLLEGEKGMDYNKVFEMITMMKFKIKSLEATRPSLESAFLKLVREDGEAVDHAEIEEEARINDGTAN